MPPPTRNPSRRFRLLDGILLIAATALGLSWSRAIEFEFVPWDYSVDRLIGWFREDGVFVVWKLIDPVVICWMGMLVILRLASPRPRGRRLGRQPGFVACLAGSLTIAAILLGHVAERQLSKDENYMPSVVRVSIPFVYYFAQAVSFTIGGAWLTLWLTGAWRAEKFWIDRSGRLVGAWWLITGAVRLVFLGIDA